MKGVSNEWKRGDRVTFYEEQKHKERRGENQRGTEDEQRGEMRCGHSWDTQTQLGSLDMDIHCDF